MNVGWYGENTTACPSGCTNQKGYVKAGNAPSLEKGRNGEDDCVCVYKTCDQKEDEHRTNYSGAIAHVNYAINEWLKPLSTPYGSTDNPIISGSFVHGSDSDRKNVVADLTINFLCSAASNHDNSHGWNKKGLLCTHAKDNKGSCFGYVNNNPPKDGEERIGQSIKPTDPHTSLTGKALKRHNTPIIYIGDDARDPGQG